MFLVHFDLLAQVNYSFHAYLYIYMYYNIPNFRVHHGHLFNFQMFSSLDVWMA